MKIFLLLPITILANSFNLNYSFQKIDEGSQILTFAPKEEILSKEFVGHWKRIAGGSDDNKNRVLDESEKMKLEPGAQDNLQFFSDGKCKVFGMGLEVKGTWQVKNYNGKKTIFVYVDDPEEDRPQKEKDDSAMRFEIVSLDGNKLVVIPPIFSFMLSAYSRN